MLEKRRFTNSFKKLFSKSSEEITVASSTRISLLPSKTESKDNDNEDNGQSPEPLLNDENEEALTDSETIGKNDEASGDDEKETLEVNDGKESIQTAERDDDVAQEASLGFQVSDDMDGPSQNEKQSSGESESFRTSEFASVGTELLEVASNKSSPLYCEPPTLLAMDFSYEDSGSEGRSSPFKESESYKPLETVEDDDELDSDEIRKMLPLSYHNKKSKTESSSIKSLGFLVATLEESRKNGLGELESQIGPKTVDYGNNVRVSSRGEHTFVVIDTELFQNKEEALVRLLGDSKFTHFNKSYAKEPEEETAASDAKLEKLESEKEKTQPEKETTGNKGRKLRWERVWTRGNKASVSVL